MIAVSIAATMKLTTRNINITRISIGNYKQIKRELLVAESISILYSVFVPSSVYPLSYYLSTLTTAVQSGSFSTILQLKAAQYNSTALLHATSSSITIGK